MENSRLTWLRMILRLKEFTENVKVEFFFHHDCLSFLPIVLNLQYTNKSL